MIGDFPTEDVEAFEWNRVSWDERVLAHWESEMYRRHADALRAGGHGLDDSMISRVGELHGKSLIHLQCHMGMETLGWTRLGARAVGVDFSGRAIERAEHLRDELGLDTRFFEANVYDAPAVIGETFDVVFVSIGSICWLPDIARWARVVSAMLEPGGMLLMNDVHPMLSTLDDAAGEPGLALRYPYLDSPRMIFDDDGSYADTEKSFVHRQTAQWVHPLGDTVTSLVEAGLRIELLEESARCVWPALKAMEETSEHTWELPEPWRGRLPASFTLVARGVR